MKYSIFYLLFFSISLFSQSNITLAPHPTENGIRFSLSISELANSKKPELIKLSSLRINSISVAGSFNQWRKNEFLMKYDPTNAIWFVDIPLKEGIEYHYKYVINDSIWITDPNAPNITEDEWQNGIIIPVGFNKPYAINVNPPFGKRITKLQDFTCQLVSSHGKILKSSIECFLNDRKIKFTFDDRANSLKIRLPENLSEGEHKILIKFSDDKGNRNEGFLTKFFLDRYKAKIKTPHFYNYAIVYEIFIRKFFDSNNDGIGDFNGLIQKLDYLKNLGVDALWLMPFNESSKEHGYNVIDYYSIEKDYGSFDEYFNFLRECKKRNIRVIKDIVINHCDTAFVFFRDAKNNPSSKYSSWFQFTDSMNSTWKHFGIEIDMPKFNFENEEVQDYFLQYVKYWMDPDGDGKFEDGIDGIRCDAAKEIPHAFWNKLRKEVKKIRPDFLILGEVWDGANYLIPFFEDEFDMLFDYPFYYSIQRNMNGNDSKSIESTLMQQSRIYPENFQMLRFLSNHDNHRALSLFNEDTLKYFQSLVMLFTLPGTPMIYYGDEIGLTGRTPPENVRQWMRWDRFENNLIYELHRKLIELRKKNKALSEKYDAGNSSLKFLKTNNESVIAFTRETKREKFLVIINNSENFLSGLKIDLKSKIKTGKVIFALSDFVNNKISLDRIELNNFSMKPREALILKL